MKLFRAINLISITLTLLFLTACGGRSISSGTGTLSLGLTDASRNDVKAAYVTINEVQVHFGDEGHEENGTGNWDVVATPNKTYNLLELVNGIIERLGITELKTGHYTQLRMIIGNTPDDGTNILNARHMAANYFIDQSDGYHELEIPSGYQTGIKIVYGFDIAEDQITELVLDFNILKSVVKVGNRGKWILKPTIKVINMPTAGMVGGIVSDGSDALKGVSITAQKYEPTPVDIKDQVIIQNSTTTESDGSYLMYLRQGAYNLVLYKNGYLIVCRKIEVDWKTAYDDNFTLMVAPNTGTVVGDVTIEGDEVNLSFRRSTKCEKSASDELIEVISESIAGSGNYNMSLPTGDYTLVVSTDGEDTIGKDFSVAKDTPTAVNIEF